MKNEDYVNSSIAVLTSISIGNLFFQALGTLMLAVIGAIGAWIFTRIIKPKLDKLYDKYKKH